MSQQCASCGGPLNAPAPETPATPRRELILTTVEDLATTFLFDDRKEDDELPSGAIDEAVTAGEVTVDEIVSKFREALTAGLADG